MSAFAEKAVKKVLATLEKCWHSLKELLKNVEKLRNVLAFPEGAVKKVLASIEKCWHLQKELLKKCWQSLEK
jgi:HEPN domain-containing protein